MSKQDCQPGEFSALLPARRRQRQEGFSDSKATYQHSESQTRHRYTVRPSQLSVLQWDKQTESCLFFKPTRSEVKSSSGFHPLCKLPKTVSGLLVPSTELCDS